MPWDKWYHGVAHDRKGCVTTNADLLLAVGAVGLAAGFIGSMLGIGGGIFLVPLFSVVLGIPLKIAIATSLVAVVATAAAGANVYLRQGLADVRLAMLLEIPTVLGAISGGLLASVLDADVLSLIFVALAFYTAWNMVRRHAGRKPEISNTQGGPPGNGLAAGSDEGVKEASVRAGAGWVREYFDVREGRMVRYRVERLGVGMLVSVLGGMASGLLGIGGGIIKVPVMALAMRVPMRAAVATSNFMVGITAAASAMVYFAGGLVDPLIAATAALAVLVGANLGARTASRVDQKLLSWIFALLLGVLALQMLVQAVGGAA